MPSSVSLNRKRVRISGGWYYLYSSFDGTDPFTGPEHVAIVAIRRVADFRLIGPFAGLFFAWPENIMGTYLLALVAVRFA